MKWFWLLILSVALPAHAVQGDKELHFLGGAGVAYIGTLQTGSAMQGFAWGVGVNVAKEAIDAAGLGKVDAKDLVAGALGAAVGAAAGRWSLNYVPSRKEVQVSYRIKLE